MKRMINSVEARRNQKKIKQQFYLAITKLNIDGKKEITIDSFTDKNKVILLLKSHIDIIDFTKATTLITDEKGREVKANTKDNNFCNKATN